MCDSDHQSCFSKTSQKPQKQSFWLRFCATTVHHRWIWKSYTHCEAAKQQHKNWKNADSSAHKRVTCHESVIHDVASQCAHTHHDAHHQRAQPWESIIKHNMMSLEGCWHLHSVCTFSVWFGESSCYCSAQHFYYVRWESCALQKEPDAQNSRTAFHFYFSITYTLHHLWVNRNIYHLDIFSVLGHFKKSTNFNDLDQWFSNRSWSTPSPAYFVCLSHLSHLVQLISSLVETARPEVGVSDIGRHTKRAVLGVLHGEVWEPLP